MIKKICAVVLSSLCFASSMSVSGLVDSGETAFSAYAEEADLLETGTYVVPIKYTGADNFNNVNSTIGSGGLSCNYSTNAILTVEDDIQSIVLGVENWSDYTVFLPSYQHSLSDSDNMKLNRYPTKLFERAESAASSSSIDVNDILIGNSTIGVKKKSEAINDYFLWNLDIDNDIANKFGDFTVVKYDSSLDKAYIKFTIENYDDPIRIFRWFNPPPSDGVFQSAYGYVNFIMDIDSAETYEDYIAPYNSTSVSIAQFKNATVCSDFRVGTCNMNFTGDSYVNTMVLNAIPEKKDDIVSVKYYFSELFNEKLPSKIMSPISKSMDKEGQTQWWLSPDFDNFETIEIKSDDNGYYFQMNYNVKDDYYDCIFGKYIYMEYIDDTSVERKARFTPALSSESIEPLEFVYEEKGVPIITIKTNTSRLPKDTKLIVEKNRKDIIEKYFSTGAYDLNSAYIYSISFSDSSGNVIEPKGNVTTVIALPDDFTYESYGNMIITPFSGSKPATSYADRFDEENKVWNIGYDDVTDHTYALVKLNPRIDVTSLNAGIYNVSVNFVKNKTSGEPSMANSTLVHDAFVVVDEYGNRTLYANMTDMQIGDISGLYIGEVYCNDISQKGNVYKEDTTYLEYCATDEGKLVDNAGYNAITEWACIKGIKLTLDKRSYDSERNSYSVGVVSPVMAAMGNIGYDEVYEDDLVVELVFSKAEPQSNMTEKDVKELFPYDISALTRQVELAKLKIASKKSFSTDSIAKVQKAYDAVLDAFDGTYDPLNKAEISADKLEKLGTNLENAIKALDGITVAGYNAQLDKDVTFDFYLSMNKNNLEAAQDGDLTANITKADGSTETVEVGEDGKIEFNVAPKEIGQTLKVKIGSYEFTYSVQEYLEKLIWYAENPTEGVEVSEKDAAIAKSLLVYGGYAQDYFVKKDAEANAYVDTERAYANVDNTLPETADNATTFTAPQLGDNIKYYGAAVVFDYTTDIRLYFTVDDAIENHSFAVNDKAVDAVAVDGGYYIAIENIYANQLGNPFKITVDGTDFQYGVYNYIAAALNATEVKSGALNELQALVKALYQYAELTKTTA